jgi:hypothetical protein
MSTDGEVEPGRTVPHEQQPIGRFQVVVEEGPPRGDLYELEQTTTFRVVDRASGDVILTFRGLLEASFSRDTGLWDDYSTSGVREVILAPNEDSVTVRYHDGREERVSLP